MIDLDFLMAPATPQPGAVLLAGSGALTGIGTGLLPARPATPAGPVAAAGISIASPVVPAAGGFQAALAKVQLPPSDQSVGSTMLANSALPTVIAASTPPSETIERAPPATAPAQLTPATVPANPATIGAIAPASTAMPPPAIAGAETPAPAIAQRVANTPPPFVAVTYTADPAPISQPVVSHSADGNLPKPGKALPVGARPVTQGNDAAPAVPSTHHDASDAQDIPPAASTADPIAQPALVISANMAIALPASPPPTAVFPARVTKTAAAITTTTAIAAPAPTVVPAQAGATADLNFIRPAPASPLAAAALAPTLTTADAALAKPALAPPVTSDTLAPAPSADHSPAGPAATLAAPLPLATAPRFAVGAALPVAPAQSAPDPGITVAQPIRTVTLAAPILAGPALANLPAGPSTASRLARQSGAPRNIAEAAATGSAPPAPAPLSVMPDRVATTGSATARATAPPQDFAALVDRLLDARASAQSAHAPQQISTTITHGDFGKVSLTFEQGSAGLSVSMTSADPGFAPAAQSAIGSAGHSDAGRAAIVERLSVPSDAAAVVAGQALGSANQGFGQPNTPGQGNPGTAGQDAGFATAGGGSSQSQAQAQPQSQQRPGFIGAASRTPAAAGSTTATNQDIFA